jgi:hypothetical protein
MLGFPAVGGLLEWDTGRVAAVLQPLGLEEFASLDEGMWTDATLRIKAFEAILTL